ncbi:MAG: TPM domain-containing protein [Bacteriovoracaceae bacterium]|nr:TPM domain-containing protein [Bacteriovoracaceae bacterium]
MILNGKIFNKNEEEQLKQRVIQFENNTGAELVIAVAKESDPYPGAVLRSSIFMSFFTTLLISYFIEFAYSYLYVVSQLILTFLFLPLARINIFKSWALVDTEVEREVDEKALEVFFTHCSDKASHSNETMIYASLFEKRIEILVGKNIKEKIEQEELQDIVDTIKQGFIEKNYFTAYKNGLDLLEEKLIAAFPEKVSQSGADELSNNVLWL